MAKMKKIANVAMIVLIVAALASFSIACGRQEAVEQGTQASEEQAAEAIDAEQTTQEVSEEAVEEVTEEDVEVQEGAECPSSTIVEVESTNGAYSDSMPITWDSIGSQSAFISHSTNNTGVSIYIANFETDENLKDVALSDGQAVIDFTLTVAGEGEAVPVSVGKYNVIEWVDNYVNIGIKLANGSTLAISNGNTSLGDFEITSVTDTEICGKFDIDEKWTKMSGEFRVPISE